MESLVDSTGAKRKRSPSDVLPPSRSGPLTPLASTPNLAGQINYLTRQKGEKLQLIEGDDDTFNEVLQLLDEYDGVLQRRESLAGNLGANLVGPLLLNAFENYFQSPIFLIGTTKGAPAATISWVDVVNFAREFPEEFFLEDAAASAESHDPSGPQTKVCRFWIKNNRVQISENDWRLIVSGVPARMLPEQLNAEDENAEMITLDILESRLSSLIKKADAVATRTRQLNYQMKGRKNAIMARRSSGPAPMPGTDQLGEWSQQSTNTAYNAMALNPQDLLRQFSLFQQESSTPTAAARNAGSSSKKLKASGSLSNLNTAAALAGNPSFTSINQANTPRSTSSPIPRPGRSKLNAPQDDPPFRAVMVSHIEKLSRGDVIWPPCDRCRRLKINCIKNYTACLGCTKKHCKCFFRDVNSEEVLVAGLEAESEVDGNSEAAEKRKEESQKVNEGLNEKPSEPTSGQEGRDVDMGGVADVGVSSPSANNGGTRSYYDSAAALLSEVASKPSPNGIVPPAGYSSTNPNTMTATMTVPSSGGPTQGSYAVENPNYPGSGHANAQLPAPPGPENYLQQQSQTPNANRNDVNYIRPIGMTREGVVRDVYSMPPDQAGGDWKANQQRDIQEPAAAFFAELQRQTDGNASNDDASVPDSSGAATSA